MSAVCRVVVTYRVCQAWRSPVFSALSKRRDIELTVLHGESIPGTKLQNGPAADFHRVELPTRTLSTRITGRSAHVLWWPSLGAKLRELQPHVVLAEGGSNFANNLTVFRQRKSIGFGVVWWTLGELPGRKYSTLGGIYRRAVRGMERRADALLGYSSVAKDYFRRMGYAESKCFVAVNTVETDSILARAEDHCLSAAKLRDELAWGSDPMALFVGALEANKRIDELIEAFARVRSAIPNARLLIVGGGAMAAQLRDLAKSLSLEPNAVYFTGPTFGREHTEQFFAAADVFVLPGLGGLAISEALAYGIPVLCGQGDGCEVDLVADGITGYRRAAVDSSTREARINWMESRLVDVLGDPERALAMGRAAVERIANEFSFERYLSRIRDAISYAAVSAGSIRPMGLRP